MFTRKTSASQPKRASVRETWFPSTRTSKGALEAAKQSAYAYFALAFGYVVADALLLIQVNPLKLPTGPATLIVNAAIAALAALLGYRAMRKPGLIKAILILLWATLEFVGKVEILKSGNIGVYWLNIGMTLWAINGLRGAVALRGKRNGPAEAAAA